MRSVLFSLAIVFLSALPARHAHAETPAELAEGLAKQANAQVQQKQIRKAAMLFEEAFGSHPIHKYAWNSAQLWLNEEEFVRAHRMYRLASTVAESAAQRGKDVEAIGAAEGQLLRRGYVRIAVAITPQQAVVQLDGASVETIAGARLTFLRPGKHRIIAVAGGHVPLDEEVVVQPGIETRIERTLTPLAVRRPEPTPAPTPTPAPPAVKPEPPRPAADPHVRAQSEPLAGAWKRLGAFVSGGVGLAALVTGAVLMGKGASDTQAVNDAPVHSKADVASYGSRYDDAMGTWKLGAGAGAVGVVALGAATWMWLTQPVASARGTGALLLPIRGGAHLSVGVRF